MIGIIVLSLACGPKNQKTETATKPEIQSETVEETKPVDSEETIAERGRGTTVPDSVCRGYPIPKEFDPKGCTVSGPFPGELIDSISLATELEFQAALEQCRDTSACTGISTSWYTDVPWGSYTISGTFRPNLDSYGCVILFDCP